MKKILTFNFLFLLLFLNFKTLSKGNVNNFENIKNEIIKRSNKGGSNIINKIKNFSLIINLSLMILNIKNVLNLRKNLKHNTDYEKLKFFKKIKFIFNNYKKNLLIGLGSSIWFLIYFRTIYPLYKNRQRIFNFNNEIKNENIISYNEKNKGINEDNEDFILVQGTNRKDIFCFLKHSFGFSSNVCNNQLNEIKDNDFKWSQNLCINDREKAGKELYKNIKDNILNNNKKILNLEGVSYGNEVILNALNNLLLDKNIENKLKNKKIKLLMSVPPINERYLNILQNFLDLNSGNKIIVLNNFNEESLLIDISNRKNIFNFGKAQSDLTLYKNKNFYEKNKNKILGLMSIDKNNDKEISHHEMAVKSTEKGKNLIKFIEDNKNIKYGNNYFLSNFY